MVLTVLVGAKSKAFQYNGAITSAMCLTGKNNCLAGAINFVTG